jgi:TonB family protein
MNSILAAIAWKSVFVLGTASILALVARQGSAAVRHLIWTAAAAALIVLPLGGISLPAIHFAAAERVLAPAVTFSANAIEAAQRSVGTIPGVPAASVSNAHAVFANWPAVFAMIWMLGASIGLSRLLFAWIRVNKLQRQARTMTAPETAGLCRKLGVTREVRVIETAPGSMPMTLGWIRPAIALPADAMEWDADRRRAVLLHELAHVRRADVATQLLARAAFSLYWWNPLTWFGWREFLKARERAADDVVLEAGARPSDYARHLLEIARSEETAEPVAAIAMVHRSDLEGRLKAIIDPHMRRKAPGRIAISLACVGAALAIIPVTGVRAQTDTLPADVDATIRSASGQKDFAVLDRAANGFTSIRNYATARKLLEASLNVRAAVDGEHSATYSDGLIHLGDLAWSHYAKLQAKEFYEQALAMGDRPEAAQALMRLGILSLDQPVTAEGYLQRAMAADQHGALLGQALAWMAEIRVRQQNTAEADALFGRARAAVVAGSADEALVNEMYAAFLTAQNRGDEAQAIQASAAKFRAQHIGILTPKWSGEAALRIGGGVKAPSVASKVEPGYSKEAAALKVTGTVVLQLVIGSDGLPVNVELKRGLGFGLDERALDAVAQWHFTPGSKDGAAVPVIATIEMNFRLL